MKPTILSIQILCENGLSSQTIDYFGSKEWSQESESEFIAKIHELFSLLRGHCTSLDLNFVVQTNDINYVRFILNKKKNRAISVNHTTLSSREKDVLELIMMGMTSPQMADRLCISPETVKSHRRHILKKTGATNTASLVTYYHQTFFEK
ncbi:MAG: helix-turn-helix transcriptional regulator [Maribacter sp.]|uniref:response regulator transcription factor n=1 Tax=Maribacter sp. TaxID=1897614 RepID=UPI003C7781FE